LEELEVLWSTRFATVQYRAARQASWPEGFRAEISRLTATSGSRRARTRGVIRTCCQKEDDKTILGYYTLPAFAIDLGTLLHSTASKLPHYPLVPITLGAIDQRITLLQFGTGIEERWTIQFHAVCMT
jgi:hypothetical protein